MLESLVIWLRNTAMMRPRCVLTTSARRGAAVIVVDDIEGGLDVSQA